MFISNPNVCNEFSAGEPCHAVASKWPAKELGIRVFSSLRLKHVEHRGYYPFFPLQNWPYSITAPQHPGWIMLDLFTCLGGAWGCDEGWIVCPVLVGQWTWQLRDSTQQWIQWQCPLQNQGSYIFNVIIFEHDIPTGECEVLGKEMTSI